MTNRWPLVNLTRILVPAAVFALGFLRTASADVATMDEFTVTRNGAPIFTDAFSTNQVLAGGGLPGAVLPSGTTFLIGR
jgi:hypothetical protein